MRRLARAAFRRLVEPALLATGVDQARRATLRGRVLILAYHNIVPAGDRPVGDRSLHLPQRSFAEQLDQLTDTHDVVSLPAIFDAGTGRRPRAVITFDDAYRGALTVGLEEITSRGLPATVFVAPGIVGDRSRWWDVFADPTTGALEPVFRDAALTRCQGKNDEVVALAGREGRRPAVMPDWARIGSDHELVEASRQRGVSFGAHSWSHANLPVLPEPDLVHEVQAPMAWLTERFASTFIPWLAWPYGLHSSAAGAAALREHYEGALLVTGGFVSKDGSRRRDAVPRFNVPSGISLNAFVLRAAGLFTRK